MLRFLVSESLSASAFLSIGSGCAQLVTAHLRSMGVEISEARRVMDFGCGCGRTLRWLLDEYKTAEFHGVDVSSSAINWCRKHLSGGFFVNCNQEPPLPYPDEHFDVIYSISVFTHLDQRMQDLWLAELRRLLKPGGWLLITVHGERAAGVLDASGLQALRAAGLLHWRSNKLKGIVPEWYHTTWHSQAYIVQRLSQWFQNVGYEVVPGGSQDVVVGQARE
jgi:ubiquinone/menaquinone biosynthesis C-methylase UbiE